MVSSWEADSSWSVALFSGGAVAVRLNCYGTQDRYGTLSSISPSVEVYPGVGSTPTEEGLEGSLPDLMDCLQTDPALLVKTQGPATWGTPPPRPIPTVYWGGRSLLLLCVALRSRDCRPAARTDAGDGTVRGCAANGWGEGFNSEEKRCPPKCAVLLGIPC